jgi:uncharacterized protein (DUF849 family)
VQLEVGVAVGADVRVGVEVGVEARIGERYTENSQHVKYILVVIYLLEMLMYVENET